MVSKCLSVSTSQRVEFDGTWEQLKSTAYKIAVDTLRLKIRRQRGWFDDNDSVINKLLETRRSLHRKLLNSKDPERIAAEKAFKENKSSLQRELRQMKNRWWSDISVEVQNAYVRKDMKRIL